MPDGTPSQNAVDPLELWRQWNETTSRMWMSTIDSSKEPSADPYNFYRSWAQSVNAVQEQMRKNPLVMNSQELWKAWFSTTMETWKRAASLGGDPLGLTKQWLQLMEDTQKKMLSGESLPADPFTFFRQWYDTTSEQWSKTVETIIGSEQFLEASAPFMESYTSLVRAFRKASEEYFKKLQLPTLSDIARVAELVVNLEEKVDTLEDTLDTLKAQHTELATTETVNGLEKRFEGLATNNTVTALQQRLDQVEGKLDTMISLLEKISSHQSQDNTTSAEKVSRKGAKKNTTPTDATIIPED